MKKLLIVVDMQNDFITGSLGGPQAQMILPNVKAKIEQYKQSGDQVLFTRDTHQDNYLATQEGKHLPVTHCIQGTEGHLITKELGVDGLDLIDVDGFDAKEFDVDGFDAKGFDVHGHNACDFQVFDKPTFGSLALAKHVASGDFSEIELCGLCTDICVVSNALILKAQLPETPITVDASCCAGVTEESHNAALLTMKMCQVNVTGQEESHV